MVGRQDWPSPIEELHREMERFLDHFTRGKRPSVLFSERAWAPPVDVYETDDLAVVLIELAGVQKDEIRIEVEQDHLMLRGVRRPPYRGVQRTFYALEVPYGAFERVIQLPFAVDAAAAEASYRDGFLEIVLPRLRQAEPRRVPIRSADSIEESQGQ